jgi:hypothetical protein
MLALSQLISPRDLLSALEAQSGRRLPLALGRVGKDDDDDDDDHHHHDTTVVDALPRHWLLPGGVVELSALPGAMALSVAFTLATAARDQALATGRPRWIGAVDAGASLCAPALAHVLRPASGLVPGPVPTAPAALQETLVVRPGSSADAIMGCAQRLVRSGACCAVVVDAAGLMDLSALVLPVRRLVLAAESSGCAVLLLTSSRAHRSLPLPVAARALVEGSTIRDATRHRVVVRPVRHRHGLPPLLQLPRRRLSRSVIDDLSDELTTQMPATTTTTTTTAPMPAAGVPWPA